MNHELDGTNLAAVDLGSNSFHMIVATLVQGEPVVVDRLREQVQLAAGLDEETHVLDDEALARALSCLERFGHRLRTLPGARVRAVGTNTLRRVRNAVEVQKATEQALGHPIEIISGREEARLIYLGVAHALSDDASRLVVDIGGGSTEVILGERFEPGLVESLSMGCVHYSRTFFPKGVLTKEHWKRAVASARAELQTLERRFLERGWDDAVGASGTIRAAASVAGEAGWSPPGQVSRGGLKRLTEALLAAGNVSKLTLPGLKSERAPVLPGGLAILKAIFDTFRLDTVRTASGALREGVLYDLLGRIRHEDVRERTIRVFQERFHVDPGQAARVERTAERLFESVCEAWKLGGEDKRMLVWAARLHEVGLALSYSHHHRHSAYLVANSDMPGFSHDDQQLLAAVVANHRRKPTLDQLEGMRRKRRLLALRLTLLLRLAVLLNRGRSPRAPWPLEVGVDGDSGLVVRAPEGWADEHPLARTDLEGEARAVRNVELKLRCAWDG